MTIEMDRSDVWFLRSIFGIASIALFGTFLGMASIFNKSNHTEIYRFGNTQVTNIYFGENSEDNRMVVYPIDRLEFTDIYLKGKKVRKICVNTIPKSTLNCYQDPTALKNAQMTFDFYDAKIKQIPADRMESDKKALENLALKISQEKSVETESLNGYCELTPFDFDSDLTDGGNQ